MIEILLGIEPRIIRVLLFLVMIFAAVALARFFYQISLKGERLKEAQIGKRVYEMLEGTFRRRGGRLYERLAAWLKGIGAGYFIRGFEDPFYFLAVNTGIFLGSLLLLGSVGGLGYGLLMGMGILALEVVFMISKDKADNQDMLGDISFLYDGTAIQLSGNIYVAYAVENCIPYMENKRLRQALVELSHNLMLGGDVKSATRDFGEKFHNPYLDTFCNVLIQITSQTGEAGDLIEDMGKQLTALQETGFLQKKKSAENKLQMCIIGIFLVFTALVFYLSIASMNGSMGVLF